MSNQGKEGSAPMTGSTAYAGRCTIISRGPSDGLIAAIFGIAFLVTAFGSIGLLIRSLPYEEWVVTVESGDDSRVFRYSSRMQPKIRAENGGVSVLVDGSYVLSAPVGSIVSVSRMAEQ